MPAAPFHRPPPPDHAEHAAAEWAADLIAPALALVRAAAAESESVATALAALERQVSWEGPAAREFRSRADGLCRAGSTSATTLETLVDDLRALRVRLWALAQDAAHGG